MLKGKVILVTGASHGIGWAIASACGAAGASVGVHYHTSQASAVAFAERLGGTAVGFDLRDADAVRAGITGFANAHGRLDGLVCNAGVTHTGLAVTQPWGDVCDLVNVNLLGTIACAQAALPAMIRQRSGVILTVSSVAAVRPSRGQAAYAASKGGIEAFTRALAVEYGRKGIRVLGLRPGPIDTKMLQPTRALAEDKLMSRVPLRRVGSPEEIAHFAVLLLSDRAAFATGSIHSIDGGYCVG